MGKKQGLRLSFGSRLFFSSTHFALEKAECDKPVGKYGRMRLRYLQGHRKGLYSVMLLNGTMQDHLYE